MLSACAVEGYERHAVQNETAAGVCAGLVKQGEGMSKIFSLGVFRLGDENVRVRASVDYNHSSCASRAASKDMPLLECKLQTQWPHTVAEMTHEAMEWSCARRDCGWYRGNAVRGSSDAVVYAMDHSRLDDVSADVGMFLAAVLPELANVHKKSLVPHRSSKIVRK